MCIPGNKPVNVPINIPKSKAIINSMSIGIEYPIKFLRIIRIESKY
jgi:hypothetical protein